MPFSFETFAWAVSALFQLLAVCAYLLSFPDVDGVDDQLPDVPEVIQDIAIDVKIKDDAGLVADFALVAVGREPKNFPEQFRLVEAWVEAGENGAVPAVARVELLGDVHRKEHVTRVDRASVAAVNDKIHETVTKDEVKRNWYHTDLSDMSDVPGAEWMAALADESDDVETVGDLAMVDVFDKDIMVALIGHSHVSARLRLWRFKRDAADFLGVTIPKEVPAARGRERPLEHQRVPDGVANRFVPWLIG